MPTKQTLTNQLKKAGLEVHYSGKQKKVFISGTGTFDDTIEIPAGISIAGNGTFKRKYKGRPKTERTKGNL